MRRTTSSISPTDITPSSWSSSRGVPSLQSIFGLMEQMLAWDARLELLKQSLSIFLRCLSGTMTVLQHIKHQPTILRLFLSQSVCSTTHSERVITFLFFVTHGYGATVHSSHLSLPTPTSDLLLRRSVMLLLTKNHGLASNKNMLYWQKRIISLLDQLVGL